MPSTCCVCKRVKQIGDTVSFHKFPFYNQELLQKWIKFVEDASGEKSTAVRKISKFSSICSQHFQPQHILDNGINSRKSLRKYAVPTIFQQSDPIIVLEEEPAENYELCGLCRTLSRERSLIDIDENNFSIMRKCLPYVNFNLSLMHKICCDCSEILKTFSSFIDRVLIAQNVLNEMSKEQPMRTIDEMPRSIKLEPFIEDEMQQPRLTTRNFESFENHFEPPSQLSRVSTSQKKCEILEIVDIKPFNFLPFETNALTCENLEQEDEIQVLSPKQLKVEINDQDDGENELELIKNYVYVSTIFMHDHNYVKEVNQENNVKIELDEELQVQSSRSITPISIHDYSRVCCSRIFKTVKQYLLHKIAKHKESRKNRCIFCKKEFASEKSLKYHKRFTCIKHIQLTKKVKSYHKILAKRKEKPTQKIILKRKRKTEHVCNICNKTFKGSKNLYQHKNATHRLSLYSCKICDKSFKMKHGLKQHIKGQHEKQKLFNCPICNHSFALKGDLKRCRHSDLKRKNIKEEATVASDEERNMVMRKSKQYK